MKRFILILLFTVSTMFIDAQSLNNAGSLSISINPISIFVGSVDLRAEYRVIPEFSINAEFHWWYNQDFLRVNLNRDFIFQLGTGYHPIGNDLNSKDTSVNACLLFSRNRLTKEWAFGPGIGMYYKALFPNSNIFYQPNIELNLYKFKEDLGIELGIYTGY